MGLGEPQKESLSLIGSILTLLIIGLPCVTLLCAGLLVLVKKRATHPGDGYRAI